MSGAETLRMSAGWREAFGRIRLLSAFAVERWLGREAFVSERWLREAHRQPWWQAGA